MLTTRELALEAIGANAVAFASHTYALSVSEDDRVHHVHQARVATRRLRAALKLFGDLLPESASSLRDHLEWIAGRLGNVRDLDVQVQRLESNADSLALCEPLAPYAAWLKAERDRAVRTLREALQSERFTSLTDELSAAREWSPPTPDPAQADEQDAPAEQDDLHQAGHEHIRAALKPLRRAVRNLHEPAATAELHRVRIKAKRARYTVEFFEGVYGAPATRLQKCLAAIQEVLGGLQDSVVSQQRIDAAVAGGGATWPPRTILALGRLEQHELCDGLAAQARFPKAYRRARTAWQRFPNLTRS